VRFYIGWGVFSPSGKAEIGQMQPHSLNDATVAAIEKAEVAISHRPGSESVAAFDRAVQIVSDEFLVINR